MDEWIRREYPFLVPVRYKENWEKHRSRNGLDDFESLLAEYMKDLQDFVRFFAFRAVFEQLQKEGVWGDFLELGVYKGNTAILLAWMARKANATCYLLDTFEGFDPRDLVGSDAYCSPEAFTDTSMAAVSERVGHDNVQLIAGYFPETSARLPADSRYALVHIDCDLGEPIRAALEYFYPRMNPGGFIVVHDYSSLHWDAAENAVDAFFADKPESIMPMSDYCGSAVIRMLKPREKDPRGAVGRGAQA